MFVVGERIDDVKGACKAGELFERALGERSDHNRVDPSLEASRDVGDWLALSERDIGLQADGGAMLAPRSTAA